MTTVTATVINGPSLPVQQLQLAYLRLATPMPQTYVGGLMVTDYRGMPVAFHYTEPIQPNKIQQILYGQSLSRYIRQEVMLGALLKGLNANYHCVIVDDDHLLNVAVAERLGAPVVRVSDTQNVPRLGEAGTIAPYSERSESDFLLQPTPETNPIRVQTVSAQAAGSTKALPAEAGMETVSASIIPVEISDILGPLAGEMDIVEPLRRIDKALEAICQEAGLTDTANSGKH